jgi:hypothetical protein
MILISPLKPQVSTLEWIFVDPVETAIDQVELVAIHELQFHFNLMAIHGPGQNKLVRGRTSVG